MTYIQKGLTQVFNLQREIFDLRHEIFPNIMHDQSRLGCSLIEEVLPKLVEDIVIFLHFFFHFGGEQVLEQPLPLKETGKFVDIRVVVRSTYKIPGPYNTLE